MPRRQIRSMSPGRPAIPAAGESDSARRHRLQLHRCRQHAHRRTGCRRCEGSRGRGSRSRRDDTIAERRPSAGLRKRCHNRHEQQNRWRSLRQTHGAREPPESSRRPWREAQRRRPQSTESANASFAGSRDGTQASSHRRTHRIGPVIWVSAQQTDNCRYFTTLTRITRMRRIVSLCIKRSVERGRYVWPAESRVLVAGGTGS